MNGATQLYDFVDRGGALAVLLLIIVGGMRGWYVWAREHEEVVRERDFWRTIALDGVEATKRAVGVAERRS